MVRRRFESGVGNPLDGAILGEADAATVAAFTIPNAVKSPALLSARARDLTTSLAHWASLAGHQEP